MDFKNLVVQSWRNTLDHLGPILLVTFVQMLLIIFTLGILAPVTTAGYFQSLLRLVRDGREPEIKDLFSQMRLFFPLLIFFLLFGFAAVIGFSLLFLPGFAVVCFVAFAALYLIPLMTDQELGLFEALKKSWDMAMEEPVSDHIVVTIIYLAIMSIGSSLPPAFLITQPLATFVLAGAYLLKTSVPEAKRGDDQPSSAEGKDTDPPFPGDNHKEQG